MTVFLDAFSGAVFGMLCILYLLSENIAKKIKRYTKSSFEAKTGCNIIKMHDDIDEIKIRLTSLESIFSRNKQNTDDLF